jgi:phosphate transport system substrate-binding protein
MTRDRKPAFAHRSRVEPPRHRATTTFLFLLVVIAGTACSRRGGDGRRTVIQNKGSDTLLSVAQAWAEAYGTVNAEVAVAVTGGGSGTGISALLNGTVDIANSSRTISEKERAEAKERGVEPKELVVGFDALAVFVHPANPLKSVSLAQLAGIYGDGGPLVRWSQLGVRIPGCPSDEIILVSRQNNSGTYQYFAEAVLAKRDFKLGSRDMHGSKDVVDLVAHTPCAIGYSGLAYDVPEVEMLCVAKEEGKPCVPPNLANARNQSYPIARPLFMYTNGEPKAEAKAYLDWIMGDEGQCVIYGKGYAPATEVVCK